MRGAALCRAVRCLVALCCAECCVECRVVLCCAFCGAVRAFRTRPIILTHCAPIFPSPPLRGLTCRSDVKTPRSGPRARMEAMDLSGFAAFLEVPAGPDPAAGRGAAGRAPAPGARAALPGPAPLGPACRACGRRSRTTRRLGRAGPRAQRSRMNSRMGKGQRRHRNSRDSRNNSRGPRPSTGPPRFPPLHQNPRRSPQIPLQKP